MKHTKKPTVRRDFLIPDALWKAMRPLLPKRVDRPHSAAIGSDKKYKNTYQLSTRTEEGGDKFPIPLEALKEPEFWVIFLEATEKTQMPFLRRAIDNDYIAPKIKNAEEFKNFIAQKIFEATTEGDKNLEKAVVINFLKEIKDALGDNQSFTTLLDDYDRHLKYNSTLGNYYYEAVLQDTAGSWARWSPARKK